MEILSRASGGAAVMRHASARRPANQAHADATPFTLAQQAARYGLTMLVLVLGSLAFATQIHATLR
jgi:hypothetical protein